MIGRSGVFVGSTGRYLGVLLGIVVAVSVGEGVALGLFILSKKNKSEAGVGSIPVVAVEYAIGNVTRLAGGLAVR